MITNRPINIALTLEQCEAVCQLAATAGKSVQDIVQTFMVDATEDVNLRTWLDQKKENNFLSYLAEEGKLKQIVTLVEEFEDYINELPRAFAKDYAAVLAIDSQLVTTWALIKDEYKKYKSKGINVQPIVDKIGKIKEWKSWKAKK